MNADPEIYGFWKVIKFGYASKAPTQTIETRIFFVVFLELCVRRCSQRTSSRGEGGCQKIYMREEKTNDV
jgi:hypothetical protein